VVTQTKSSAAGSGRGTGRHWGNRRPVPGRDADGVVATILAASAQVMGEQGIERTRISDVAVEAGVSPALVSYYFPSRSDLVRETFVFADARTAGWVSARIEGLSGRGRATALLTSLLEVDDVPRASWTLWCQAWPEGLHDAELAGEVHARYRRWVDELEAALGPGYAETAIELTALVDGLAPPLLHGWIDRARAAAILEAAVARALDAGRARRTKERR